MPIGHLLSAECWKTVPTDLHAEVAVLARKYHRAVAGDDPKAEEIGREYDEVRASVTHAAAIADYTARRGRLTLVTNEEVHRILGE